MHRQRYRVTKYETDKCTNTKSRLTKCGTDNWTNREIVRHLDKSYHRPVVLNHRSGDHKSFFWYSLKKLIDGLNFDYSSK